MALPCESLRPNLFRLSYCVLVPLSDMFLPVCRSLYRKWQLPVPPLWIGGVFIGCFLSFRVYIIAQGGGTHDDANEVKETFLAICFLALALAQFLNQRTENRFKAEQQERTMVS